MKVHERIWVGDLMLRVTAVSWIVSLVDEG